MNGRSTVAPDESYFRDLLASVGVVIPLGPEPMRLSPRRRLLRTAPTWTATATA